MNVPLNVVIGILVCITCIGTGFALGKIDERSVWRTAECASKGGSMITYNGSVICAKVEKLK
jgi:F0F1-type ATP synthase membrane subunit c/vacuolar-type H+-ATPase subunit K